VVVYSPRTPAAAFCKRAFCEGAAGGHQAAEDHTLRAGEQQREAEFVVGSQLDEAIAQGHFLYLNLTFV